MEERLEKLHQKINCLNTLQYQNQDLVKDHFQNLWLNLQNE